MIVKTLQYIVIAFALLLIGTLKLSAQAKLDTTNQELNEAMIVKNQQQNNIDSLIKQGLIEELKAAGGNKQKTIELEKKLAELERQDSLNRMAQIQEIEKLKKTNKGYPVVLLQDTIFYIFTRTGSFDAKERAEAVSAKIKSLYEESFYNADSLTINKSFNSVDILYKNKNIILTISDMDALWFNTTKIKLAQEQRALISNIILKEKKAHSLVNWAKRIGLVCAILVLLWLLIRVINFIFRKTGRYIIIKKTTFERGIKIKNTQIVTAKYIEKTLLKANEVLRFVVIILTIYLSLPLLFSIFPETEGWTNTLLNWILTPLRVAIKALVDYLPDLFTVLVIYILFKYCIKGIRFFFIEIRVKNIRIKNFHADWAMPTFNILRVLLYAFMLIIIFPFLPGSSSPAFQGVSVFLGILLSLGSSSATSNMVAGLVITYMRPFKVGDRVKIGEVIGDVVEKTMLVTRLRTIKNEDVTVPNSMVLSNTTTNYSSKTKENDPGLILHYTVTVGYSIPWQKVYTLLTEAASLTMHVEKEPAPFVLQTSLDEFYISYQINAYTKQANMQAVIYSNLLENIQNVFGEAGVEILSPHYNVIRKE
jgi:small-conductance mechanosensitive channel